MALSLSHNVMKAKRLSKRTQWCQHDKNNVTLQPALQPCRIVEKVRKVKGALYIRRANDRMLSVQGQIAKMVGELLAETKTAIVRSAFRQYNLANG